MCRWSLETWPITADSKRDSSRARGLQKRRLTALGLMLEQRELDDRADEESRYDNRGPHGQLEAVGFSHTYIVAELSAPAGQRLLVWLRMFCTAAARSTVQGVGSRRRGHVDMVASCLCASMGTLRSSIRIRRIVAENPWLADAARAAANPRIAIIMLRRGGAKVVRRVRVWLVLAAPRFESTPPIGSGFQ